MVNNRKWNKPVYYKLEYLDGMEFNREFENQHDADIFFDDNKTFLKSYVKLELLNE
jgi:hypothetical protein